MITKIFTLFLLLFLTPFAWAQPSLNTPPATRREAFSESALTEFLKKHISPQDYLLAVFPECRDYQSVIKNIPTSYTREFEIASLPVERWPRTSLYYATAGGKRWWILLCGRQNNEISKISALLQPNMFSEGDRITENGVTLLRLDRKDGPLFEGKDLTRRKIDVRLHPLLAPPGLATDIQGIPQFPDLLFVTIKNGSFQSCSIESATCTELLKLDVADVSELGLLGVAFHPQFNTNRKVYLRYDIRAKYGGYTNRVSEFTFPKNSVDFLDPKSERVIFETPQISAVHSGGQIAFGPDKMMYLSLGDAVSVGVRSLDSLRGKILRIDVNSPSLSSSGKAYACPKDNPFFHTKGALQEVWAWGLRNPWRFAFDAKGRMWVGDVGENTREEITIVERGGDCGWNIFEGTSCFNQNPACPTISTDIKPIHDYGRDEGNAVIGGTFAGNADSGALRGLYIFGDGVSGRLWAIDPKSASPSKPADPFSLGRWPFFISTFGRTGTGAVVFATFLGSIYRIEPIHQNAGGTP